MAKQIKHTMMLTALTITISTSIAVAAQEIKPPTLEPVAQFEAHREVLRKAVALHDRGEYDEAIRMYESVLKENPADVSAIYELGYSFFAKGDYKKSLETAYRGAAYKSKLLSGFYTLIGNNLDQLGQPEKALKVYGEGVKQFPRAGQLHYNMAVTLLQLHKPDDARKSLKEAVRATPDHASSHLALSQVYIESGYKIPALLAACRFLMLEPNSQRSGQALQIVKQITQGNVTSEKDSKNINILIDTKEKTDEGDFTSLGLALGILGAGRYLKESKNKTEAQLFAEGLSSLLAIMSESDQKSSGFAWQYYRPYFNEISRRKLAEPFGYFIQQSTRTEDVDQWLTQHFDQVQSLLNWSRSYRWPDR